MNIEMVREKKVYFNTYTSMIRLIENSYYCQHKNHSQDRYSGTSDFCTVNVGTARGAGHTEAILKTANSLFDKSMIVCHKRIQVGQYDNLIDRNYPGQLHDKFEVESINSLNHLRGSTYDNRLEAVFVDNADILTKDQRMSIYEFFLPILTLKQYYFFIFVG